MHFIRKCQFTLINIHAPIKSEIIVHENNIPVIRWAKE